MKEKLIKKKDKGIFFFFYRKTDFLVSYLAGETGKNLYVSIFRS